MFSHCTRLCSLPRLLAEGPAWLGQLAGSGRWDRGPPPPEATPQALGQCVVLWGGPCGSGTLGLSRLCRRQSLGNVERDWSPSSLEVVQQAFGNI